MRSKVLEHGYINIYSKLEPKEKRQIEYKVRYKEINQGWDETLVFLSKKFKELTPANQIVLDAGCGHGNYVIDENRRRIKRAIGVDVSKESTSKNVCLDKIVYASLEKLPFRDNYFDSVISLWVLEHLKNPQKCIEEIHRVLKPKGYFFFATPNYNFLPIRLIHLTKANQINKLLNRVLFGRYEEDVFPAYYKANTLSRIRSLVKPLFVEEILKLNYDPSYTSFNDLTFRLSNTVDKVMSKASLPFTKPHIIGILRKKGQSF